MLCEDILQLLKGFSDTLLSARVLFWSENNQTLLLIIIVVFFRLYGILNWHLGKWVMGLITWFAPPTEALFSFYTS